MEDQSQIRNLLVEQLSGEHAHAGFERAVDGLTLVDVGIAPGDAPHTIWELVEHIRIAQYDILEFSRNPDYTSPPWPEGYWPTSDRPSTRQDWEDAVDAVRQDRRSMVEMVRDPRNDLLKPFEHGSGQTLFREAILIIDHSSYHTGQIVQIRRMLGNW